MSPTILLLMAGFGGGVIFVVLAEVALLALVVGLEGDGRLQAVEAGAQPVPPAPTPSASMYLPRPSDHAWFPGGGIGGDPPRPDTFGVRYHSDI